MSDDNDFIILCLASYGDQGKAEAGWHALREADKRGDLQLRAGGVVVADEEGHLDVVKDLHHPTGKGALIGGVLALATPVTMLAGVLGGAAAGKVHKNVKHHLTKKDLRSIGQFLHRGDVLVVGLLDGEPSVDLEQVFEGAKEVVSEVVTHRKSAADTVWMSNPY